jgi:anti-repressor protein
MTELINHVDETFNFNESRIRVIGNYETPLFVAKDICEILGLKDVSNALLNIPEKWKGAKVISTLGGEQNMRIINEAGLYKLIMRSNKPIAQKFQEVVCEEILPTLRKKGEYKIQSIIDKNKALEEEKMRLQTKFTCECGREVGIGYEKRHMNSKIHRIAMELKSKPK